MKTLSAARAALHDSGALLGALLDAWRSNRAPELADAIAHVSRSVDRAVPPLGATGQKKAYEAWLSRAKKADPADLEMLLRDLLDGPPAYLRARLEVLEGFGDDPRISTLLTEYVCDSGGWMCGTPVGTAIFKALGRHGDARSLHRIRASEFLVDADENVDWRTKKVEALAKAIAKQPVFALGVEALQTLVEVRKLEGGPTLGEALFADAAEPSARAVATDQLLEEGTPRGELIVLQQAKKTRPLTTVERKREQALLAANAKLWMGVVAKVIDISGARFEEGVFVGGQLRLPIDTAAIREAKEWSTVRAVDFGPWKPDVEFLRLWPNITEVVVSTASEMLVLANAAPPLGLTKLTYSGPDEEVSTAERKALSTAGGFPTLTHLSLSGYWHNPPALGWILEGELAQQLTHLSLCCRLRLEEWVKLLALAPPRLQRARIHYAGGGVEVTGDPSGAMTCATITFKTPREDVRRGFDHLLEALGAAPKGLFRRISVGTPLDAPTKAHRARLDEAIARLS